MTFRQTEQSIGTVPTILTSHQTLATSLGVQGHLHLRPTDYKFRCSQNPHRFDNVLQWFTELRKVLYLQLQFYTVKVYKLESAKQRHVRYILKGSEH